jgi:hypothetical protein
MLHPAGPCLWEAGRYAACMLAASCSSADVGWASIAMLAIYCNGSPLLVAGWVSMRSFVLLRFPWEGTCSPAAACLPVYGVLASYFKSFL